jgi:hypothetical protein
MVFFRSSSGRNRATIQLYLSDSVFIGIGYADLAVGKRPPDAT